MFLSKILKVCFETVMILILHMSLVFTITYNQIVVRTLPWLHGLT